MKLNKTKYLILILIAIFFASTNELSAKEVEQNYNIESHAFLETGNYVLSVSYGEQQKNSIKAFTNFLLINHPDYSNNYFNLLSAHPQKFLSSFIYKDLYLDLSILRI
ncbi:MAG: hypothetical protein M1480_17915 [Bacteroidetes bacterium]|nr:hypothetical protein [Bacteroidota bacterium]